jgi:hypothetical protein
MQWTYQGRPFDPAEHPEAIGFVYLIRNLVDGRGYIGKKRLFLKKRKTVTVALKNGTKKKKRKSVMEGSDWRSYYGSNDELKADVARLGEDSFTREVLHICPALGVCSYLEAKEQFRHEVMEHPDAWYNRWLSVRVRSSHLKTLLTQQA